MSKKTMLEQSVHQGTVLLTQLLLFFIDDLQWGSADLHVGLFANDVAIYGVETRLQQGLDAVTTWRKRWIILLSVQKSDCSFFSANSQDSMWQLTLTMDGQPVR